MKFFPAILMVLATIAIFATISAAPSSSEESSDEMPISDDEQTDDTENEEETIEQTENGMQIIVRNLMGENFTFEVSPTNTISEFKAKIEEKGWSPISMLLFDGEELQRETRTLGDYKIQNGSTVFVVYRSHDTKNNWINPENEGKLEANKTIKIWFD